MRWIGVVALAVGVGCGGADGREDAGAPAPDAAGFEFPVIAQDVHSDGEVIVRTQLLDAVWLGANRLAVLWPSRNHELVLRFFDPSADSASEALVLTEPTEEVSTPWIRGLVGGPIQVPDDSCAGGIRWTSLFTFDLGAS